MLYLPCDIVFLSLNYIVFYVFYVFNVYVALVMTFLSSFLVYRFRI